MPDLARLFRPRHVAVFGGSWGREVIRQMHKMGFAGEIWPIHPEKREVGGLPAFTSVDALPAAPDASFIGVNRFQTIELVKALDARGSGGAVCFASGFGEVGDEGVQLQADLVAAAGDMAVLGPNCYGFINALDGALLWPDLHGCERVASGVAVVTQSSNIAINLTMARRALPIAYVVCLGNQAATGLHHVITALAEDDRVSVIAIHIEGISDPHGFVAAVAVARARGKPVIALRVGRSEASRAISMSHTASLAGGSAVAAAFLARCGVAEVETIPEFLETAKLLHVLGPLGPGGLVSLSCSGGEASLMADAAERAGVAMPSFGYETAKAIRATVNPLVTLSNPFDYHTFDWGNRERLAATFAAVMRGPQALTALVLDFPRADLGAAAGWDVALQALGDAADATGRPAAVIATVPECLPEDRARALLAGGIAPLQGVAEAMAAIRAATEAHGFQQLDDFVPLPRPVADSGPATPLDEWEAKALLRAYAVPVPEGRLCSDANAAAAAVADLAPAAMKAIGASIAHKTEIGALVLNVRDAAAARAEFARLSVISPQILVERMISAPVAELIVGAARDPALGLHMIIGAGGVLAELLADRVVLIPPVTRAEITTALASLRVAKLLAGWRGKPAADMAALVEAVAAIAELVVARADVLEELDVNPLIATATGAVAADALIRLRQPG